MAGIELKTPCPFCGGKATIHKHFRHNEWHLVHRCKALGSISIDWTDKESLIKRWEGRKAGSEVLKLAKMVMKWSEMGPDDTHYGKHDVVVYAAEVIVPFAAKILEEE